MAQLSRLPRPWLLDVIRTQGPSMRTPLVARGFCSTSSRAKVGTRHGPARQEKMPQVRQPTFLLPGTLVTPALRNFPSSPAEFGGFIWYILKTRVQALGANLGAKIMSMDRLLLSRPKLKLGRAQAVPAAKALHAQMSEAVAAADVATIRRVCLPELADNLIESTQNRPRGVRYDWQLVKYNSTTTYPRLADFRAVTMPIQGTTQNQIIKQAVVSIASTQKIARYDDSKGGTLIPGSERTVDLVEHIVLQAPVSMRTWTSEPWKIWGTISESTYQDALDIDAGHKLLEQRQRRARM